MESAAAAGDSGVARCCGCSGSILVLRREIGGEHGGHPPWLTETVRRRLMRQGLRANGHVKLCARCRVGSRERQRPGEVKAKGDSLGWRDGGRGKERREREGWARL